MPNVEIKAMLKENKNETPMPGIKERLLWKARLKKEQSGSASKWKLKAHWVFDALETIGEIADRFALHLSRRIFNMLYIIYNLLQDYSRPNDVISLGVLST